ncbi:MAG: putative bifunctional diguanylate cyclase/phosphodiesterase [Brevundimonas sp.]
MQLLLQNDILEMVARGEPLAATAEALCVRVEALLPGVACSILMVDPTGCLRPLAAPGLPRAYSAAFDGLPIGPDVGSCGAAIYLKQPVEATDIATDPRWKPYAYLPLAIGLRACWSTPIIGRDGDVLGAFAFYFRQPRGHTCQEAEIVQASIHLCAIAMERDQQAAAQYRLAYRDMLTDLPNRAAFNAAGAMQADAAPWALLLIDLDNLKTVNDTFGHRAGDCLIRAAASRIQKAAGAHTTYRLGGDEFAVLIEGRAADAPVEVADLILAALSDPVDCDGHLAAPRATIGCAIAGPDAVAEDVRQNADFALYHAKETRRGGVIAYTPDLGGAMSRRLTAIRDVGVALQEDRIDAHYQPVVRLDTGEIVGLEALFRVVTPSGEVIPAGDYFDATTDIYTATRLTHRMLDIVARDVRAWLDQGIWFQHVGVNVSSADFQAGDLHELIRQAFAREDVPLHHIILEVTETVYMAHDGLVAGEIQKMRANGLRVALDDFGTGFASLTHLLSVPVDIIKIDKSFIARMEPESRSAAIVEGLLTMANKLGIRVVAEGVEDQMQAELLRTFGCTLAQGYLYARPVDRRTITTLLYEKAQKRDPDLALATGQAPDDLIEVLDRETPDDARLVRYAILLCGEDWRVVSERRQFGRFPTRAAAFQCAMRLAREANASGATVELLHADAGGELKSFYLPDQAETLTAALPETPKQRPGRTRARG